MITFEAEVIETRARKTASMDKVIRIVLETDQIQALELQKYIADKTVIVEVKDGQ